MKKAVGLVWWALLLLVVASCRSAPARYPEPPQYPPPQPRRSAAPPPATAPAPVAEPVTLSFAAANFAAEKLDECVDMVVTTTMPDKARKGFEEFVKELGEDHVKLTKPCEKQFADRTYLAICKVPPVKNNKGKLVITSRYYDKTTLANDAYMKHCLQIRGDWTMNKVGSTPVTTP